MGAKKKAGKPKKITPEKVTDVVASLADPDADALSRVRKIAETFELEKIINVLDASDDIMSMVRERLHRGGEHYTLEEAAAKAGLEAAEFAHLNLACGFADPGPDARVFTDEDVEILQLFQASTVLFGEDVAMQNVRVMGSAMARVADAFISSFAMTVGRQSLEREVTEEDLRRFNETAIDLLPSAVRAMDVLLRRHLELKSRMDDDFRMGSDWEGVDAIDRAVGFCDLVGYTALAQQISDARLASLLRAFETTAADLITARGADVVKLIGDEVMFVAHDAPTATNVALELAETFGSGDVLPPVRCGVAAGRVIVREGDYHGPVVNLAARIVKLAPPGGVLIPRALKSELTGLKFEDAGSRDLKGFADAVELVRVSR